MSYQALARKWRPQRFDEVIGQSHVMTALTNALTLGRLHHAYLFSGTRGVGKTSIARLFAKGLNCEQGITATPCGHCQNCVDIEQGRFIDLLEIDAASRTKVEDTRDLLDNIQYLPARGRFKIYLIDEVHMLSRHSFNALLKTLEEPPEYVKFLLATTDPQKLPVTILSRCLHFHLRALESQQIIHQLEKILSVEQVTFENRGLTLLARAADGSMRDALSLTDQAIAMGNGELTADGVMAMLGELADEQPLAMIEALVKGDGEKLLALVQQIADKGLDWQQLLISMLSLLHQIAMLQLQAIVHADYQSIETRLRQLAHAIEPDELQLYYQIILNARKELSLAPSPRMGVEMALLRVLAFTIETPPAVDSSQELTQSPTNGSRALDNAVKNSIAEPEIKKKSTQVIDELAESTPASTKSDAKESLLFDENLQAVIKSRQQLKQRELNNSKKSEAVAVATVLPQVGTPSRNKVLARSLDHTVSVTVAEVEPVEQSYRWQASQQLIAPVEQAVTPKTLRQAVARQPSPELTEKLLQLAIERDQWSAEVERLVIPRLAKQLALNAFKEMRGTEHICLHLRSTQRHLNSEENRQLLNEALNSLLALPVHLSIEIDDNMQYKTPLEWRNAIFEEKLQLAKQTVQQDPKIDLLCRYFDAQVDADSVQPI